MDGGGRRMISVDRWNEGSQAYFLTHLHSDHTEGLSSKWSRGLLFCSPTSALLLPSKFPGFNLSLLRVLEIGTTSFIPLVSTVTGRVTSVSVTPIDAHHCPGAVMYLFKGEFGCVLHTGDFRWELEDERVDRGKEILLEALSGDKVGLLYLDNTYCHPSFAFPSREIAARQVIDVINLHPDHDIVIGIDKLGKEELLLAIARILNTKIWVWPERLQTMHILGFEGIFTTKTNLTRVRAVPRYSLTVDNLVALNKFRPTIGIMPTGLPYGVKSFNDASRSTSHALHHGTTETSTNIPELERHPLDSTKRQHQYIYTIPYSDHSCFTEIKNFVELVQPVKIMGIVFSSICYINPGQYFSHSLGGKLPSHKFDFERNIVGQRHRAKRVKTVEKHKIAKEKNSKTGKPPKPTCIVRRSRISLLRRDRHGAKLLDSKHDSGIWFSTTEFRQNV